MIHPALAPFAGDGPAFDTPVEQLRATSDRTGRDTAGEPPAGIVERDHRVASGGVEIPVREYRATRSETVASAPTPEAAPDAVPAVVYFHGGGWVTGSIEGFAAIARNLARFSGGAAFSVDYRLAPEHPFPAPLADCVAAARWVQDRAAELGVDPERIVLAGDSAGAHLALSVALALRDAGRDAAGVAAFYPCLDPACSTPSWESMGTGHFLTRERMRWYWQALLGRAAARPTPGMTPWLAEDFSGLPPTWIMVAEHDPLRDEGEAFAHDLRDADVEVGFERRAGMLHGFLRWRTLVPDDADGAVRSACEWLLGAP